MNILITGITGSGGSYLAEYILENHPEVKVHGTTRWHSTSTFRNVRTIKDKICLHECDLNDLSSIVRVLEYVEPVKIFHTAAHANVKVCFDTPLAVLQNNIMSTANLLEAIRHVCPTVIFQMCSTSEVCGTPEITPITEEHPLNPSNPYAVSKLASEKLSYAYWKSWQLKVVITRAFCYTNPRRHDIFSTAFALQVARIEQEKQDVLKHGNLDSIRTMIDVRDICEGYWIASEECDYGTPYNLGGVNPIGVGEFLDILKSKALVPIRSTLDKNLLRPTDITSQLPDITKFCKKTGWQPKIPLDESINWLLEECREEVRRNN